MTLREKILKHPAVQDISDERGCGDGIWVNLKDGWEYRDQPEFEGYGSIHEDTWTACYKRLSDVVKVQEG